MNSKNLDIIEIDTLGLKCPMPLLMLKKAINHNIEGSKFKIIANDALAQCDISVFCNENNYQIIQSDYIDNVLIMLIEYIKN